MNRFSVYTAYLRWVNALIDTGKYQNISTDEVVEHAKEGDLVFFLFSKVDEKDIEEYKDTVLAAWGGPEEFAKEITDATRDVVNRVGLYEEHKWGVFDNGLCLIIVWLIDAIGAEYLKLIMK